jgi:multidrug resistance efflux pump
MEPVVQEELFFRTPGYVDTVFVELYDSVSEGQVLAELVVDDLERELNAGELELERVESNLREAKRDLEYAVKRAQVNLEIAQLELENARARDPGPLKTQAEADLKRVQIVLRESQETYNRVAWRNDLEASAEAAVLEQATLDYAKAEANHELALQAIAEHPAQVEILERQVELAQITLDELEEGIDPLLNNDVERAESKVSDLKAKIADAQVVAPFDGQVLDNYLSEGYMVEAFKIVMMVADPSDLEVRAKPDSMQLQEMEEGMAATMTVVNRPGEEIMGHIERLPSIYGVGSRAKGIGDEDETVHITLDEAASGAGYDVGELIRVTVAVERRDNVLWVPPEAVRTFEGREFVVVRDGEAQRRVDVEVGIRGDDRVEIEAGLTEGEIVVAP